MKFLSKTTPGAREWTGVDGASSMAERAVTGGPPADNWGGTPMRIEMRDVERQLEEGHTEGSWCLAQWGVGPAPGEQGLFVSTLVMRVDGDVERLALELYGLDDRDGEPPRGWQLLGQAAQSGVGSTLAPLMGDLSRFSSFRLVANLSGERGAGVLFSVAVGEIEGGPGQLPAR